MMATEQDYWNQMYANACDQSSMALRLRLVPFRDGASWCVLYGDDLQSGIAGFGDSPDEAMRAFDLEFSRRMK